MIVFTSGVKRIFRAIDSWFEHVPTDAWVKDMMIKAQLAKHRAEKERERQIEQEPVRTVMGLNEQKVEIISFPGFIAVDKTLNEAEIELLKAGWRRLTKKPETPKGWDPPPGPK